MLLLVGFAVVLPWFPVGGMVDTRVERDRVRGDRSTGSTTSRCPG